MLGHRAQSSQRSFVRSRLERKRNYYCGALIHSGRVLPALCQVTVASTHAHNRRRLSRHLREIFHLQHNALLFTSFVTKGKFAYSDVIRIRLVRSRGEGKSRWNNNDLRPRNSRRCVHHAKWLYFIWKSKNNSRRFV